MPKYWMISNRALDDDGLPGKSRGPVTYWVSDAGNLGKFSNWTQLPSENEFRIRLIAAADRLPPLDHAHNEGQKHVTFFIHGYNNGWDDAARSYERLCNDL